MDILGLAVSGGGISAIVVFGVLGMAMTVFIAGAALALKANRSAHESRLALQDAEMKLSAAGDLANEVRELRARVEEAIIHHNDAVNNARYQHNEACAPQAQYAAAPEPARYAAPSQDDHDGDRHDFKKSDDDHKKHHSAGFKKHDDDHKKHHSAGFKKHDDDHKKHHRDSDDRERRGFLGWFFDR
jgi:hypothetical protein